MRRSEIKLRSWIRRLGLAKYVKRLANRGRPPEWAVRRQLDEGVRPGDVVWDVGANGGWYSVRFAKAAGETGRVWSFEPVPVALDALRKRVADERVENVVVVPIAMGEQSTTITMQLDPAFPGGKVHEISGVRTGLPTISKTTESPRLVDVQMRSGDEFLAEERVPVPQVIKIDVEGFELEVLRGLRHTLAVEECRSVMVEVHFALLEARGNRDAPIEVERLLRDAGFATRWVDRSHLWATKVS